MRHTALVAGVLSSDSPRADMIGQHCQGVGTEWKAGVACHSAVGTDWHNPVGAVETEETLEDPVAVSDQH